ncbi:peptidylprolyl isomerase [Candidatus Campbellbacteria bacterium CG10_big_fil_rev_8_21_14_0_10_35_52]|uniref:Peptidyl-prolyl cis-trans isomerase n=1 Tax=Candidatus Campbellbacteria bacterium CG10_big_fil_rev_8_21_14_0_10_35_52 TaxID=1974527 RepID=A0A2M6WV22_9BACT|nr:MAG: peptidylprolyl isomerase [Candidatus Campbellbacteria bacterium CG10_big_fil_rev_8_21_14_0_10_35_52]
MKKLNKNEKIAVFVSLAVILFFFAAASIVGFISNKIKVDSIGANASLGELTNERDNKIISSNANNMTITDISLGTGKEAKQGQILTVHYTGALEDGTKFDSSIDRNTPFRFILGAGQVIKGWEIGFFGMKVGGKRKLVIPAELAYGSQDRGNIPANSTLFFDVELLAAEDQETF